MNGGVIGAVAARAEAWLLEPAPARAERALPPAPVVAVIGLGRGCGTTTIARAVASELARRHASATAVVHGGSTPTPALATAAARRVARRLGGDARACGRLAIAADDLPVAVARELPLVLDVGHGTAPEAALALADRSLLVACPDVEPALAGVAAEALARDGASLLVVLNRAVDADSWGAVPDVRVGESKLGARLALAGRDPLGALGTAAGVLADACLEAVVHA